MSNYVCYHTVFTIIVVRAAEELVRKYSSERLRAGRWRLSGHRAAMLPISLGIQAVELTLAVH